jgi:hypothetical protein
MIVKVQSKGYKKLENVFVDDSKVQGMEMVREGLIKVLRKWLEKIVEFFGGKITWKGRKKELMECLEVISPMSTRLRLVSPSLSTSIKKDDFALVGQTVALESASRQEMANLLRLTSNSVLMK